MSQKRLSVDLDSAGGTSASMRRRAQKGGQEAPVHGAC